VSRLVAVGAVLFVGALLAPNGALATLLAAAALVAAGVAWFEAGPDSTRELALVATLGAAAAAGRVLFAAIPGVQPVTVVTVVAGVALGLRAGVAVGALAAFVSNLFLGQGVWTPQQMLGWAACGAVGALFAPALRSRYALAAATFVLGLGFSALMDIWLWYGFFPHTGAALAATLARGLWFDVSHGVGNVVIALAIGPELLRMLERYGTKLRAVIVWA
jgi:energy-coupling factor transport system substrate-specific component